MKIESEEKILIKTKDKKNFQVSAKFLQACPGAKQGKGSNVSIDYETPVIEKIIEYLRGHDFCNFPVIPKPLPHCKLE